MSQMGTGWSRSKRRLAGVLALALLAAGLTASSASAALDPADTLTYIPFGYVHSAHSAEEIDEVIASLDSYGVGQALLPMPKLKRDGTIKVSRKESRTIPLWVQRTAIYDALHATHLTTVAVFDGRVKKASLNLEEAAVRANIVGSIESISRLGVGGVQLDFEPYPSTPGYVTLLREIDGALTRVGFHGRFSVCAPASVSKWSPAYLAEITSHLTQVDPLFYDSEMKSTAAYEKWVREGLAYYSANTAPGARIVPVIPSYGPNRWHDPGVENIATATTALGESLAAGNRVNGAGIFWWWGFYYEEEGAYDPTADQAAWPATQVLAFTP